MSVVLYNSPLPFEDDATRQGAGLGGWETAKLPQGIQLPPHPKILTSSCFMSVQLEKWGKTISLSFPPHKD